jgi:hypothetical protein
MAAWPGAGPLRDWQVHQRDWVQANDSCRRDILRRLSASGPLPSRELPDNCSVPWRSTGWTNNRNVTQLLDFMARRGEVAVAGRQGNERLWDLAERVYPDMPAVPLDEAVHRQNERRLTALGLARSRGPECPVEPLDVSEAGEEAVVEGVKGTWRVDPSLRVNAVQWGCEPARPWPPPSTARSTISPAGSGSPHRPDRRTGRRRRHQQQAGPRAKTSREAMMRGGGREVADIAPNWLSTQSRLRR